MSITQLKALTWLLSVGVAGYLGWYVYDFFQERGVLAQSVGKDTQTDVLNSVEEVEPPKDDVVDYAAVLRTWHSMDWVGKPAPREVPKAVEDEAPKLVHKPVTELLSVLLIQIDGDVPRRSIAQVQYRDPALDAANKKPDDRLLREGETLDAPYEHVQVARIHREGVLFRFLTAAGEPDLEREDELVTTSRMMGAERIVRVGDAGAIVPPKRPIQQVAGQRGGVPNQTRLIGNDHWWIGLDDRDVIARDYARILAEIRVEKHRDPKTQKVDGIEIKEVPPGAFAGKYGLKEGMVIKSINGHPITSVNEGISYAKQNQDKYDVWVILYEEQGKEKTKIIDTSE